MESTRQITGLVVPTGDAPAYLTRLDPTLEGFQAMVGGDIEALGLTAGAVVYLHAEGKYAGLPVNGNANKIVVLAGVGLDPADYLVGQVLVVGDVSPAGQADGYDYDVPDSVIELCERAGVPVEDRTTDTDPNL